MDLRYKVELKDRLGSGKVCIGTWLTIGDETIAEIMAMSGCHWVGIDLEHTGISVSETLKLIRVIDLAGCNALVRLTNKCGDQIKRVLDAGAKGIIVPNIQTKDEVVKCLRATRYAPAGTRGVGLARAQGYGESFKEHWEWQEKSIVLIAQIEHKTAVDNINEIVNVEGLDGVFIGPYDLSCSLGHPGQFDRKEYKESVEKIRAAAIKKGIASGIHIIEPEISQLDERIKEGYKFIAYSVDMRILAASLKIAIKGEKGE